MRECPEDPDCPSKIYAEGMQLATQLERQVQTSLAGLEALLRALEKIPGTQSRRAGECRDCSSAIAPQAARMSVISRASWDRRRRGQTRRSIPFTSIRLQELVQPRKRRLAARSWRAIARSTELAE